MSYNISAVRYLSGRLTVNTLDAKRYYEAADDQLPEDSFIYDAMDGVPRDVEITRPAWRGEFSGDLGAFVRALAITKGEAELLVVWEGGDRLDGLHVRDGVVARKKAVVTLADF